MKKLLFCLLLLCLSATASAEDDPLAKLKDETLRYFKPVSATIISAEGSVVTIDKGGEDGLVRGMRMTVLRQGEPFLHPVTRETIGNVEIEVGRFEVQEVRPKSAVGVLVSGSGSAGDRVRVSEGKVTVMFCQDRKVDWYLADDYYRKLKNSGRVVMVDTSLETADEAKVIEEAKRLNADVAILITAREADKGTLLRQQLFWAAGGTKFGDSEVKVDVAFAKDLKFGEALFSPSSGESLLNYNLNFGAKLVITGDFDADGKQEIFLAGGNRLRAYLPAIDLLPLWEVKGNVSDDYVWLDAIDLNRNGRDELIATTMRGDQVTSYIYELVDGEFRKIWEGTVFLRRLGNELISQVYSARDGFDGQIYTMEWSDGTYKKGHALRLPKNVNIFDFVYVENPGKERIVFSYDENGFLNVYDSRGVRVWRSAASIGGFPSTFKKPSSIAYTESQEGNYVKGDTWSIKDRLNMKNREILVVQRIAATDYVKSIGYKLSKIKNYWWNGFAMEEGTVIESIPGTVFDYAVAGDKLVVVSSPFLGIKFDNILKGENPFVTNLSVYSVRGR
ncbi:MAG: VCBS repeat-containing protein [Thermodesulfovibrionales bacterium]